MPCYGGLVHAETSKSICELKLLLLTKGIKSEWFTLNSESLIPRGRNACVAYFLAKNEHTHLLFLDADITFTPANILRLIELDKDISGLPYPKKGYSWKDLTASALKSLQWDKLIEGAKANKTPKELLNEQLQTINEKEVFLRATDYVMNPIGQEIEIKDGIMQVSEIGTGVMLIKRCVIDDMVKKFPEMKYYNDLLGYNDLHPNMKDNFYLFFDCRCEPIDIKKSDGTVEHTKRYLSEDYAFTRLCKQLGYKVFLDTSAVVHHSGNHTWIGHMLSTVHLRLQDAQKFK